MQLSLQSFTNQIFSLSVLVNNNTGEILFDAKEVCNHLEIKNHRGAVSNLDEDEKLLVNKELLKGVGSNYPLTGGFQNKTFVTEPGLYSLVIKSRKGKEFKRWVTHDVLPNIRKTGSYSITKFQDNPLMQMAQSMMQCVQKTLELEQEVKETKELIKGQNKRIEVLEAEDSALHRHTEYYAIVGYANLKKIPVDGSDAVILGKRATKISLNRGIKIAKVYHPIYSQVNSYHVSVLEDAFFSLGYKKNEQEFSFE